MPELANIRHEKFAQGVASGLTGAEAYRRVAGSNSKNADVCANDWMKQAGVKERIAELRAEQNAKSEMSRDEYRRFLVDIIRAKPKDAAFNNPLCELVFTRDGRQASFPNKLAAGAQLSKICGWDDPSKLNTSTDDTLTELLIKIRRDGAAGQEDALEANGR
jgi:hypothetical protein